MKALKMLGLAVVAAAVAMAFVGAGTASAGTKLCKDANHPCTEVYEAGTEIKSESTNPVLKVTVFGSAVEVKCTKSTVTGVTDEKDGTKGTTKTHLQGTMTGLTFTGCTTQFFGTVNCTVTTLQLNYTGLIEPTSGQNGNLLVWEKTGGQPGAIVTCGSVVDCIYKVDENPTQAGGLDAAKLAVTATMGGTPANAVANQVVLKEVSAEGHTNCTGSNPRWNATYTITSPAPLNIGS